MNLSDIKTFANRVKESSKESDLGKYIVTKIAGTTFENRQCLLNIVSEDTEVCLVRDRSNPHDVFATQVKAKIQDKWHQVGFIPKALSKKISVEMDNGTDFSTKILKVTGWDDKKGLLLRIER